MTPPRNWHNNAVPSTARQPVHGPTGRVKTGFGTCEACGEPIPLRRDMAVQPTTCVNCYGPDQYRVQRHSGLGDVLDQEVEW